MSLSPASMLEREIYGRRSGKRGPEGLIMTISVAPFAVAEPRNGTIRDKLQHYLPRLVLAPSFLLVLVFVYGFNLWTLFLSFTNSKAFANFNFVGWLNYKRLWDWTFQTDPPSS